MALPVYTPYQWNPNLTGYYSLLVDGQDFEVMNAEEPWSLTATDNDAITFQVRPGDQYWWDAADGDGAQRSEIEDRVSTPDGTPIEVSYAFSLAPGALNTASWLVLGQLHPGDTFTAPVVVGPPFEIALDGEKLQINIVATDASGKPYVETLYTSPTNIVRGQFYDMDIKAVFDPSGNGRLVVICDGVTLVDYTGSLGYSNQTGVVWKEGIYEGPGASGTTTATFENLNITTGSAVAFPDPSAFIPAPVLSVASIAAQSNEIGRAHV